MKVAIQTLGCKVNQYETQAMELLLVQKGHSVVDIEEIADAYIINSCTVTANSDRKSRQAVYQAKRRNAEAVVALCGCYPQVSGKDVENLGVDLIGGTGDRAGFLTLLEQVYEQKDKLVVIDDAKKRHRFEPLPSGGLRSRTRAMLKVEDGCNNFCAYCIIPYARGPVRSLPLKEAAQEAARLMQEGYREIVLTGIELSSWGQDLKQEESLIDLIEAVCAAAPSCRIRLGSLEPRTITKDFCDRLCALPQICPHFHLSMQSGCDETLRRMKRKYDTRRYFDSVELLRRHFAHPGITTDLIVGFARESEQEFEETLRFVKRCAFSDLHIFPYSPRVGTAGATMGAQLSKLAKEERAEQAERVAQELRSAYLESLVGQTAEVLFEERRGEFWHGHAGEYVSVLLESERELQNRLCRVTLREGTKTALYADLLEEVN